jgi:hypothetical protein
VALSACSSSSGGGGGTVPGTLGFPGETTVGVLASSSTQVTLALTGATNVSGLTVNVSIDNVANAIVSSTPCTLSSSSSASSQCTVTVYGVAVGTTTLRARASGYTDVTVPVSVTNTLDYGVLAVADSTQTFVTTTPVTLNYVAVGTAPYTLPLKVRIVSSSGITAATGAWINFAAPAGVTITPPRSAR